MPKKRAKRNTQPKNTEYSPTLKDLFLAKQESMKSYLAISRRSLKHSETKGDILENALIKMLNDHLPNRYRADKGFVIDSKNNVSEQTDIFIFDDFYSPFTFKELGTVHIPAESVYAIFEVKHEFSSRELNYAAKKIASVRKLHRTSGHIYQAGKKTKPRKLFTPLGGVLALEATWKDPFGEAFRANLEKLPISGKIDMGCFLNKGSFNAKYKKEKLDKFDHFGHEVALISFFINLLDRLQKLATVAPIKLSEYRKTLG